MIAIVAAASEDFHMRFKITYLFRGFSYSPDRGSGSDKPVVASADETLVALRPDESILVAAKT